MGQTRRIESIILAREADASKGTAVAASTGYTIGIQSGILRPFVEHTPNPANFGVNFDQAESYVTHKRSELVFTAPYKSDWVGLALAGILGTVTSEAASGETVINEHTFELSNSAQLPSFTMFVLNSISNKRGTFGTFKKVQLKCSSNGVCMVTVEMVGQQFEDGSGTAMYETDYHLQGSMLTPRSATSISGLGAGTIRTPHDFTLTFEREIFAKQVFSNLEATKFYAGPLKVTCELMNTYEDDTFRDIYEDGSDLAWRFDFQDADTIIGNAEHPGLTIDLAKLVINGYDRPEGLDEDDVESLKMKALFDNDEITPQFGSIVLTNTQATTAYTTP